MGDIILRNVPDFALDTFRMRAERKGTTLEHELRELIEKNAPFTPEERVAASREMRSRTIGVAEPLTLEEIHEGLE